MVAAAAKQRCGKFYDVDNSMVVTVGLGVGKMSVLCVAVNGRQILELRKEPSISTPFPYYLYQVQRRR